jgi:hypothetical protein
MGFQRIRYLLKTMMKVGQNTPILKPIDRRKGPITVMYGRSRQPK